MAAGSNLTDIGARVRKARRQLGMTQDELAELAGVSREFISRLENGKQGSRASVLVEIADKLGMDPVFLLRGTSIDSNDEYLVKETEDVMRRLRPSKRAIVFQLADALLNEDEGPPAGRE